jgi:hypothetical protein
MNANTHGLKIGDLFSTTWGYNQTNYDFIVIVGFTKSGKSAKVRMSRAKLVESGRGYDKLVPTGEAYGDTFTMRIGTWTWGGKEHITLRGSYPYLNTGLKKDGTRLDTFSKVEPDETFNQTAAGWGH